MRLIVILGSFAMLTNCNKQVEDGTFTNAPPDLVTKVRSSVSGFVTNENNIAVNLATVKIGTVTTNTDKYGYFEVKNVDVVKDAAVVTVTRAGYFKAIKTYIASSGQAAFFRIELIPKTNSGTINSATGGNLTMTNGLAITLPANSVINLATGAAYTGTINLAAYWINPASADLPGFMPGDLRGINTAGNAQLLTTYGMAAVELTGSGGELLQVAAGKKATVSLPIPSSLSSSAPATIPLWYFDEDKGLWIEEGIGTRSGNNYTGEVSHFSFWNFDVPGSFVQLDATIVTSTGGASTSTQPLPYAKVKISEIGNPANFRYGYTDAAGYVKGPVPLNAQLLFEVYGNTNCTTPIYTQNVSTTTTNISLGTITVTVSNSVAMVTGSVVNCLNAPITNGYVMLLNGSAYIRCNLSNTGTFSGTVLLCNNSATAITLIAEDLTSGMTSGSITHQVVPGNNTIPVIQVCNNNTQQQYIHLIKNGVAQNYNYLMVSNFTTTSYGTSFFSDPAMTIPGGHIQFTQSGVAPGSIQALISCSVGSGNLVMNNLPVNVTITEFGAIGEYIAGNYSASFTQPPSNAQYAITCNFRFKRYY
jgi:hypothetical protein